MGGSEQATDTTPHYLRLKKFPHVPSASHVACRTSTAAATAAHSVESNEWHKQVV